MNNIKHFFIKQFKTFFLLSISMSLSMILLIIRMKITHSFFYIFLVWNLFLAVIPFAITCYLVSNHKLNNFGIMVWFGIWLIFLPNAPYIITDLMHLQLNAGYYLWLDILVVISFAFNGMLLFYLSILDMKTILQSLLKKPILNFGLTCIFFLSAFGIYLGRFLRYNSWEILTNPKYLIIDITNMVIKPFVYKDVWLFTLLFGVFLTFGFWMFNTFYQPEKQWSHQ